LTNQQKSFPYSLPSKRRFIPDGKLSSNGIYKGTALRAVTLNMGGIGTGCVAFSGDGGLRQWQLQSRTFFFQSSHDFVF
jgi:hypothetical protein